MRSLRWLPILAVLAIGTGSCDSKINSSVDQDLLARINTLEDCFPNLYRWVGGLLAIADTWKQQDGANPADPTGLSTTVNMDGSITAMLAVGGTTITMDIKFYGPGGAEQDLSAFVTTPTSLADKIDAAATELRNRFPTGEKFIHGVWSIAGGGITATGEGLTGIIGGVANQNELEEVRTTLATVSGGIPAGDPSTVTDNGPPLCSLTFDIPSLITDEDPGQEYPRGVVALTVVGPEATVNATITFDKTAIATVAVDGVNGSFAFNLDTRQLTYNP